MDNVIPFELNQETVRALADERDRASTSLMAALHYLEREAQVLQLAEVAHLLACARIALDDATASTAAPQAKAGTTPAEPRKTGDVA